jgi:FAD/FMN-containing dehydrogenase/Fe-S oxidoreductase
MHPPRRGRPLREGLSCFAMDQERARIQADLRGVVNCEVLCDDLTLQMYASDASIYQVRPQGVIRPRAVADVVACVQYAAEHGLSIHARGAGTGLAGESLGGGLVLDFSTHMRRILEVGEDEVRVQPGVILAQLNRHLAEQRRLFGPDPSTRSVTTMGSVLALDGSGSHWPLYGSARNHVRRLQLVLADGTVVHVDRQTSWDPETAEPRRAELAQRVSELVRREADVIREHQPRSLINRSGYHLHDVLRDGAIDLAGVVVGSEGTLALITEATLATSAMPHHRGLTLLFFERLELAARAALEISGMGVSTCDLMDRRLLTIARETEPSFETLIPKAAEAMLLVEQQGSESGELRQRMESLVVRIRRKRKLAFDSRSTMDRDERDRYWRLARRVVPMLYRLKGSTRPLPFIEDIAVPPAELPEFLVQVQNVLKAHQVTASLFAHAGHGQLHIRPFLDLGSPDDIRRMQPLATDLYERVLEVGGTISGEHGLGFSRTWFARRQFGPLYDIFREVKRIFDPGNLLNPGKVVAEVPSPLTKNLRPVTAPLTRDVGEDAPPEAAPFTPVNLQLAWPEMGAVYAARACNGCGRCRTQSLDERMCPMFRLTPREEASPRSKANLMRAVLTGRLEGAEMAGDPFKEVADLCFHCHQCRLECPAGVDIPKLMSEAKSQYVSVNGLRFSDWILTRPELLAQLGSRFASLANWIVSHPQMRWLLEKTLGIAQGRKLPRFAPRSFLRQAHRRRLTRPQRTGDRKVLYFVDVYANWFDVQLADALVAVMEHNGIAVYVPPHQLPAGMPAMAQGAVDRAQRLAQRNVPLLAEAVRQGYQIVTTEPSAALCLQQEYVHLLGDDEARLVAEHTQDACDYLWRLHQDGRLELDFRPVNATVGYHLPCHLRALEVGSPGERLLRLIPGLTVQRVEKGCSGMAGTFGIKRRNYRASLRIGWGLISALRQPPLQIGATECSTCKIQMEQGANKPTLHPIKLLALAYGLLPEVGTLLTARCEDLVVT